MHGGLALGALDALHASAKEAQEAATRVRGVPGEGHVDGDFICAAERARKRESEEARKRGSEEVIRKRGSERASHIQVGR